MDATAAARGKKAVAAGGDADFAAPSSPRAPALEAVPEQRAPLPGDAVAAVDSASATATTSTVESDRGSGEDEQVEKFYVLLANNRAMRNMYRSSGASTDGAGSGACGVVKKRVRGAEPAWRPAFRMEDFEELGMSMSPSSPKKERRDDGDGARRPGKETADEEHGDDAERNDHGAVASLSSPSHARAQYGSK